MRNTLIALLLFLTILPLSLSWDPPPRTIDFRGFVYINGDPAPDSTVLEIWANSDKLKMDDTTLSYGNGYFQNLEIVWDDPSTKEDEGVAYDESAEEKIRFKIGNHFAKEPKYVAVKPSMEGATIDLIINFTIPKEEIIPIAPPRRKAHPYICEEKWECSEWEPEECPPSGKQARKCIDKNSCGTEKNKPQTERSCIYVVPIAKVPYLEVPIYIPGRPFLLPIISAWALILIAFTLWIIKLIDERRKKRAEYSSKIRQEDKK